MASGSSGEDPLLERLRHLCEELDRATRAAVQLHPTVVDGHDRNDAALNEKAKDNGTTSRLSRGSDELDHR